MARKATLPSTPQGLRSWLKGSKQGRELLRELTEEAIGKSLEVKCRACENARPYPKCLIVLRRLGDYPGAEVYTEEGVTTRLMELPDADLDLEELIEVRLPRNWRHMMGLPAKRISSDVFRGISLVEALRHTERGVALQEIQSYRTTLTKET